MSDKHPLEERLYVIETDDDRLLGCLRVAKDGTIRVHNGYVGRPVVLALTDIVSLVPAEDHPDVEVIK